MVNKNREIEKGVSKTAIHQKIRRLAMRSLAFFVLASLFCLYGHAYADAQKEALINSYLGEYSLITECDLFYYGIGRPRDFAKASECYRDHFFMGAFVEILAYANGHGVKRDLARAINLARELDHYIKEEILYDLEKLETATHKYELEPCKYAYSTPELTYCAILNQLREEVKLYELGTAYRDHVNARIRKSWVKLEAAIEDFAGAERDYVYHSLEGGSMQRYTPGHIVIEILRKHRENLERLANYAPDKNITAEDYRKADQQLNEKYKQVLKADKEAIKLIEEMQWGEEVIQSRKKNTQRMIQAQRKWIKYRDAMVEFYQAINDSRHPPDKVALDAMILVTRQRTDDLRDRLIFLRYA